MRRFPLVIATTAAGLAALLAYHPSRPSALRATDGPSGSPEPSGPSHPSTSTTSPNSTTTTPKSTTTTPQNTTTTTTKPSSTTVPDGGTSTATGAAQQYGYGVLATRVTVKGSRIINVQVVGLQTAESYSQQLAASVIPQLRREVLAAQSSNISGVTGATYTSQAYEASVQSALDRLHR